MSHQLLDRLIAVSKERYVPPYNLAMVYEGLHEDARAIELLQRAVRERDVRLTFLKVDPLWRRLLADPRTAGVKQRLGLF